MDSLRSRARALVRRVAAIVGAGLLAAGCSAQPLAGGGDGDQPEDIQLVVWASQEDQATADSWLAQMESEFERQHPEYSITWKNQVVSSSDAAGIVKQDPLVAGDVYAFASDQLGSLLESHAIGHVSDATMQQLETQTRGSDSILNSITGADGGVYGVPISGNTWFMYYRKSKFSPEDVTSLERMLEKGTVAFPITNSWYIPAFYIGNGGELFGPEGVDAAAGVAFGGPQGEAATQYLVNLRHNPHFVNDEKGSGIAGLASGTVDAMFSGTWDGDNVREALGEDFGVATLPSFTINGQQKQMKSFAGSTAYAWNPYTKHPVAAEQFAAFLGSSYSQEKHYELRGVIPSDVELMNNQSVKDNAIAQAQIETLLRTSVVQPSIAQMNNFWGPAENFGRAIFNGEVTRDNAGQLTEQWVHSYTELMKGSGETSE